MNTIEKRRRERKLTQKGLAGMVGVNQTSVSKWVTGASMPTAEKLPKLARVLGCTIDELLADDPAPPAEIA